MGTSFFRCRSRAIDIVSLCGSDIDTDLILIGCPFRGNDPRKRKGIVRSCCSRSGTIISLIDCGTARVKAAFKANNQIPLGNGAHSGKDRATGEIRSRCIEDVVIPSCNSGRIIGELQVDRAIRTELDIFALAHRSIGIAIAINKRSRTGKGYGNRIFIHIENT